jgi:hypothetical protein
MKSLLSLLAALVVVGLLAAGGHLLYQRMSGGRPGGGNILALSSPDVSLALTNGTQYSLTVDMRKGTGLVHFQILPGHTETRSFAPGAYSIVGKISDPNTDPFSTEWTFQSGGRYNATFSRDGQGNTAAILEIAGRDASRKEQKKK